MKAFVQFAFLLHLAAWTSFAQGAIIMGTVELPKAVSAPVMAKRYEIISKAGVLAPNPPLAVVYLEGKFPAMTNSLVEQIVQTNYTFVPAILPIQLGSKVEFPNLDNAFHNIFSYSPAKRFDLGKYRPEERPIPSQVFDKTGLITLRCEIHEHMRALILVLDTPYFVTTDPDGKFKLSGLPAGRFVLKAWVNSRSTLELPVELHMATTTNIHFSASLPGRHSAK